MESKPWKIFTYTSMPSNPPLAPLNIPPQVGEILFLVLVAAIFFIFWLHTFFVLYHLIRFGVGKAPKQFSLFSLFISIILFLGTIAAYVSV